MGKGKLWFSVLCVKIFVTLVYCGAFQLTGLAGREKISPVLEVKQRQVVNSSNWFVEGKFYWSSVIGNTPVSGILEYSNCLKHWVQTTAWMSISLRTLCTSPWVPWWEKNVIYMKTLVIKHTICIWHARKEMKVEYMNVVV